MTRRTWTRTRPHAPAGPVARPVRRRAAAAVVAAAAGATVLAGCGSGDDATAPASGSEPIVVPSVTEDGTASPAPTATSEATPGPADRPSPSASPSPSPSRHGDDDVHPPQASHHVTDTRAELDVDDQSGAGRSVAVEEVFLSDGTGFVAVFDAGGRLLGSAPVSRATRPVSVPLDEPVTGTMRLVAVLYADDGDGRFDPASDPQVLDSDNEVVEDDFRLRAG
jgi:hypothetical protein